jgi:hypothetical protein
LVRLSQSIVVGCRIGLPGRPGSCRKILNRLNSAPQAVRDIGRCDSVGLQRDWLFQLFAQ